MSDRPDRPPLLPCGCDPRRDRHGATCLAGVAREPIDTETTEETP